MPVLVNTMLKDILTDTHIAQPQIQFACHCEFRANQKYTNDEAEDVLTQSEIVPEKCLVSDDG